MHVSDSVVVFVKFHLPKATQSVEYEQAVTANLNVKMAWQASGGDRARVEGARRDSKQVLDSIAH